MHVMNHKHCSIVGRSRCQVHFGQVDALCLHLQELIFTLRSCVAAVPLPLVVQQRQQVHHGHVILAAVTCMTFLPIFASFGRDSLVAQKVAVSARSAGIGAGR